MLTLDLCQVKDVSPEGKNNLQKKEKKNCFQIYMDCFVTVSVSQKTNSNKDNSFGY